MVKRFKLPAGIASCIGGRHHETQTNHVYIRGLHDQSEHIRDGKTIVCWSTNNVSVFNL